MDKVKIYLNEGVYEEHINEVIQKIHEADELGNPIDLYISTLGGSVYECLALVDVIKECKVPVTGIALGKVQSAGVVILAACDYRKSYKHTLFMWHGISAAIDSMTLRDIKNLRSQYRYQEKQLVKILTKRTNLKKKFLHGILDSAEDWYFRPKDAKRYGLIDEIIK